jgi:S1-C subfamily serine protease
MRTGAFLLRLVAITLAAVVVAVAWRTAPLVGALWLTDAGAPRVVAPRDDLASGEQAVIALFREARDSVVFISTERRVMNPWTQSVTEQPQGTGTGFVWDALGHVVTNAHVVAGASGAQVRLADGRSLAAELVGVSPRHDLAVLRIEVDADPPRPLPVGTSADLEVGQSVLAIGNPFGLDWTLTTGIVSALDRDLPGGQGGAESGLIQTDAAINPGNSGGPLLDSAGRLIGVNASIFSPSGASAGIGFAVPVDTVNRVVPQLIARGRYTPPTLGISSDPRIDAMAARRGIEGAVVLGVAPGSAAEAAGLEAATMLPDGTIRLGDVIVGVDGEPVASTQALVGALDQHEPGDEVTLSVMGGGRTREVSACLAAGT